VNVALQTLTRRFDREVKEGGEGQELFLFPH
jgi:hypothetical protein